MYFFGNFFGRLNLFFRRVHSYVVFVAISTIKDAFWSTEHKKRLCENKKTMTEKWRKKWPFLQKIFTRKVRSRWSSHYSFSQFKFSCKDPTLMKELKREKEKNGDPSCLSFFFIWTAVEERLTYSNLLNAIIYTIPPRQIKNTVWLWPTN